MPEYEYLCEIINEEFCETHSIKIVLESCPLCLSAGREDHKPKRLISGGSGRGIVSETADEFKANLPNEKRKILQQAAKNEQFASNLVGDVFNQNYNRLYK